MKRVVAKSMRTANSRTKMYVIQMSTSNNQLMAVDFVSPPETTGSSIIQENNSQLISPHDDSGLSVLGEDAAVLELGLDFAEPDVNGLHHVSHSDEMSVQCHSSSDASEPDVCDFDNANINSSLDVDFF